MKTNKTIHFFCRLTIAIIILGITAFFTPGFEWNYIGFLASAIIILTFSDFFLGNFTKFFYNPYIRFLIGFILCGIAIYLVQYFLIGYALSIVPIILGAIVYGLVDYMLYNSIVPTINNSK